MLLFLCCVVKKFAMFDCGCYLVVECYGGVERRCSGGYTVYGLPKTVFVLHVIPVYILIILP